MIRANAREVRNLRFKCSICKEFFPREFFYEASKELSGVSNACKKCQYDRAHTPEAIVKRKAYLQKYNAINREERLAYKRQWRAKLKQEAFDKMGGKCVRCGFTDYRALQVDHVNGGGWKEHSQNRHMYYYLQVMKDTTGKYQLLCANCNWIKRWENGEHK